MPGPIPAVLATEALPEGRVDDLAPTVDEGQRRRARWSVVGGVLTAMAGLALVGVGAASSTDVMAARIVAVLAGIFITYRGIRRVVRAHINEVRYCYNQGLAKDANLKGRVAVQFTIGGTGKVTSAVVGETDLKDRGVGSCIAQAVKRWSFPKPASGGAAIVTYPFILQPG